MKGSPLVSCPKCGKDNKVPVSQWVGGKATKSPMQVRRFVCSSCGASFVAWADKSGKLRVMSRKSAR